MARNIWPYQKILIILHPLTEYFRITLRNKPVCTRGVAQLVSALRSGRRGRAFESPHPDKEG